MTKVSYSDFEDMSLELLEPRNYRDVYDLLREASMPNRMDHKVRLSVAIEDISMVPPQWFRFHPRTRKFIVIRNRKDIEAISYLVQNSAENTIAVDDFFLVDPSVILNPNEYSIIKAQPHAFEKIEKSKILGSPQFIYWSSQPKSDFASEQKLNLDFNIIRYLSTEQLCIFRRLIDGDFILEADVDLSATTVVCDADQCADKPQILDEFRSAFLFMSSNSSIYEMTSRLSNNLKRNIFVTGLASYNLDNGSKSLVRIKLT